MKKLIAVAMVVTCAAAQAATLTVKNFDEDLATVYVNGEPTTDGQTIEVEGQVTIELKDFRNDYYFRYAPASQTDRQLAFESWETGSKLVPAECATQNPAEFTVSGNLTVTPNVNVKGYCWEYQEVEGVKQMTNNVYRWGWGSVNATTRTATPGVCIGPHVSTEENNLLLDCIERVRYNGKNYTVTSIAKGAFANSHLGTWAVAPRYATFVSNLASGSGFCLTNTVGFYDIKSCTFAGGVFAQTYAKLKGPATNCVPRNATSIGSYPYMGQSGMTGELLLEKVAAIGNKGFNGCSGLTSLRITSPDLKSIDVLAFSGCSKMKEVIFAGSLANFASIGTTAFSADAVTNFNFLVAPPTTTTLDNLLIQTTAGDGAHACRLTVDSSMAAWWALTSLPSAAELGAGLPENCMGTYVTGANERKAWVISSTPVGGILLVGDMSMEGNVGFVPRTGLEIGSRLELKAPAGYDQCQLQHFVDGKWNTYDTISGTTVDYEHDGQLTRAVWSVDGAKLTAKVGGYGGTIDVTVVSGRKISDGIYEKGSVVRLTARGAAEHPTSHFAGWTEGIDDAQADTATVEVTLDADELSVAADFSPDEWLYTKINATSGSLTDGEWTMTATKTDGALTINSASGGQNGLLWLDLTLPVRDSEDLEANYPITVLNCSPTNMRKLRVAPHFKAFGDGFMQASTVLERIDGLGASQVTSFGGNFLYQCGSCPLHSAVYEANDFIPPGLRVTGWYSHPEGVPYLMGTLEMNAVTDLYTPGVESFTYLNSRLWGGVVEGETVGVTNILLTTKGLQEIPDGIFGNARVEAVTIGSTNLTTAGTSAFKNYNGAFRSLTFLAHAPTVAALDNLVKVAAATNLTVYCSKFAPGWKDLRTKGYSAMEEWAARPAGCWGIYQTADGKKRYYLVQKDSKYDKRNGFAVILK